VLDRVHHLVHQLILDFNGENCKMLRYSTM